MLKKYKIEFDLWGLALFFIIMLPTLIWSAIPAPNDPLRAASSTVLLDRLASVCQMMMVASLCVVKNRTCKAVRLTSPFVLIALLHCLLYFCAWVLYYAGNTGPWVILALCIFPCIAFFFYALDRKNGFAGFFLVIFSVCHVIYGILNFIV